MSTDFQYSTDFYGMNSYELSHTCMHLLCLAGEASFVFNEHCYHIVKNNLVVIPMPDRISNLAAHADLQVEWFAADYKFLQNLLPSNRSNLFACKARTTASVAVSPSIKTLLFL